MTALAAFAALSAASTGLSVIGQIQQGKAQERAAKFQARVQEQQAQTERAASRAEAADFRREQSARIAASRARTGASGANLTGSPLLVDEAFTREVALGSGRLINQGVVRGTRLEQQAQLSRFEGRNARRASTLGAIGTGISGGASLLSGLSSFR